MNEKNSPTDTHSGLAGVSAIPFTDSASFLPAGVLVLVDSD